MAARRRPLKLAEHASCTTRAVFLELNAACLAVQVDLEEYIHSPNKPLPPRLRGLPAPQPTPALTLSPPVRTSPPQPRAARRGTWKRDIAKLRANDDS